VGQRANHVRVQQVRFVHRTSRELFEGRGQLLVPQLGQMWTDDLRSACLERRRDVTPQRNVWRKVGGEVVAELKWYRPAFIPEEIEDLPLQPRWQSVALHDERIHLEQNSLRSFFP